MMRRLFSSAPLALISCALLTACAATPRPQGPGQSELMRLKKQQDTFSSRLGKLRNDLMLVEARLQDQQKSLQQLQQVLAAKKVTPGGEKTAGTGPSEGGPGGVGEQKKAAPSTAKLYLKAFGDYASGRFEQAAQGFASFLQQYPGSHYAANAQYWLGACYYSLHQYQQAVTELRKVVDLYPRADKTPDALLKMAEALRKLNRPDQAAQTLQRLRENFPDSPAARSAGKTNGLQ